MRDIDIEELYWADWDELSKDEHGLEEIFFYIGDSKSRTLEELSKILRLYSNPSGKFTIEFATIIANIYKMDKIRFIKALNLVKDEAINLVYIFRMQEVFQNQDKEMDEIIASRELSEEEVETANNFFKMYKTICAT